MKVTSFVIHVLKASIVILSKNHLLPKNVILSQSVKSVQSVKLFVQMVHSITLGFNILPLLGFDLRKCMKMIEKGLICCLIQL